MAKEVAVIDEKLIASISKKFNEDAAKNPELIELTSDLLPAKLKKADAAKINVTDKILTELEKRTENLVIKDISDKDGAKEVAKWRKIAKNVRTAGVGITKAGRDSLLKEQKAWIKVENDFIERVSKTEDRLELMEKENQKAIDAEKTRISNLQTQRFTGRVIALSNIGVLNDPATNTFKLGDFEIDVAIVRESEDDVYESILQNFKDEAKIQDDARQSELNGARITILQSVKGSAPDGLNLGALSQQEWEAIYLPFKRLDDEAKLAKEAEAERKANELKDQKIGKFRSIGYVLDDNNLIYFIDSKAKVIIPVKSIVDAQEESFDLELSEATDKANEAKNAYKQEQEEAQREKDEKIRKGAIAESRKNMLKAIGHVYGKDDLGDISEDEWQIRYSKAKRTYDDREAELAAEQMRSQSDSKQWRNFIESLSKIPVPSPASKNYKEKVGKALDLINQIKLL